ncbi:MAG: hypothetical protein K9W42_09200 [Candidatus Heimdallarchaeota archaeon]|nr:hypothetical protein [Candidatus Heimdallarchaeota archaeon]
MPSDSEELVSISEEHSAEPPSVPPATPPAEDGSIPYETMVVKLNWFRVVLVSLIVTAFLTALTFLVVWLVALNYSVVWAFLDWIFFIECGILFTFGGCLGTWKQSFSLNVINRRLFKADKLTGADTKLAIGSSYSYIFSALLLGLISVILFIIY